jgi:hypothetical protein
MPKAKTHDFKGKIYSEIPDEIAKLLDVKAGEELEFLNPHKDLIIITKPTKVTVAKKSRYNLTPEEIAVVNKVYSIRYYDRSRENVLKKIENYEIPTFNNLFVKGILFEYSKQEKKWVGIDRKFFADFFKKEEPKKEHTDPMISQLQKDGYLVIQNDSQAKNFVDKLKKAGMYKQIKGVRGFDKKYYIIMLDKLNEIEGNLIKTLDKERVLDDISKELKITKDLCKAAIEVLRDDGTVIEKKRELYVSA